MHLNLFRKTIFTELVLQSYDLKAQATGFFSSSKGLGCSAKINFELLSKLKMTIIKTAKWSKSQIFFKVSKFWRKSFSVQLLFGDDGIAEAATLA